ncbi:MAG TPA: sulfotransferase family 2 domain-containing protein [Acidimicrobiia bacterium]
MIVSDKYRFVLVQVPQTGSTSLGRHLVDVAEGRNVLLKHSTLDEAHWLLGDQIRGYRVVASVRNPVDQLVSSFYKLREDRHHLKDRGFPGVNQSARERLEWASAPERTLDEYVLTFIRRVHAPVWVRCMRRADIMLGFESLQEDTDRMFEELSIPRCGDMPFVNPTRRTGESTFGPAAASHLADLYGPFMSEWGYARPSGASEPSAPGRAYRKVQYEVAIRAKVLRRRRKLPRLREAVAEFDAKRAAAKP